MLSRAAERIYWTGRYLERAQNTARIVQQYSQLLLDLPSEVGVEWIELVGIFGAKDAYYASGRGHTETEILNFLLADDGSVDSLAHCIRMARDNIRNSRDLLPHESWESVNELHQYARERLALTAAGENRFEVLAECIGRCQGINGILADTMSHHSPFHFLTLGASIERADMTSRVIDVAAAYLQQNERLVLRYGSTLWTNILKSVSGFQMYRQYCQPEVEGPAVINFLLNDRYFPRAMRSCIAHAKSTAALLPRSKALIGAFNDAEQSLPSPLPRQLDGAAVSELMDVLQKKLGAAHLVVVDTWFLAQGG